MDSPSSEITICLRKGSDYLSVFSCIEGIISENNVRPGFKPACSFAHSPHFYESGEVGRAACEADSTRAVVETQGSVFRGSDVAVD